MKILLDDFKAIERKEDIFKLVTGKEHLHEITNDNEVRGPGISVQTDTEWETSASSLC
jgi:hypothetical protein